ncbi:hypothetical protein [Halorubrum sp. Hd13]|uniref:hypothetical protein n=1 Tax=Halorubrum sp. Hd13 TaxID=1480728 RepID=UPI000B9849CD|nr:hypothetical protein [Halorubrum sp. Hd13]OYR45279.1 hypothetical protein DJ81_05395 [Halorubrum sp. Hd13]
MSNQPSLVEASRPGGLVIDETGDLAEHHDHGAAYRDGEYSLDDTVDVLEERFNDVRDDLPDQVGEWTRDGHRRREEVSASWQIVHENGDEERLSLFPRGPWLHAWTLGITRWRTESSVSGWDMSGSVMDGSGYETPAAALSDAVEYMEGSGE